MERKHININLQFILMQGKELPTLSIKPILRGSGRQPKQEIIRL